MCLCPNDTAAPEGKNASSCGLPRHAPAGVWEAFATSRFYWLRVSSLTLAMAMVSRVHVEVA